MLVGVQSGRILYPGVIVCVWDLDHFAIGYRHLARGNLGNLASNSRDDCDFIGYYKFYLFFTDELSVIR